MGSKGTGTAPPVAIGAIGGSGTRVVAQLLIEAGIYMGSDLNESNDNLWVALLFTRRNVLVEPHDRLDFLVRLFLRRMQGDVPETEDKTQVIRALAAANYTRHPTEWLDERARRFLSPDPVGHQPSIGGRWGWKAPNSHILAEQFLRHDPSLRYVHVIRNGLDMAFNRNQNQTAIWAPVFLGNDGPVTPHRSLAYWCAVHRRIGQIAARYPDRVLLFSYDDFCRAPVEQARRLLDFCGATLPDDKLAAFASQVRVPDSSGIFRRMDTHDLDPDDIAYVAGLGFETR